MSCPICMEPIQDAFKSPCCKQKFCTICFRKACISTMSCPLCRDPECYNTETAEIRNLVSNVIEYKSNREHAMGYSRIKQTKLNKVIEYFDKNDYLFELDDIRELWEKKYFDLKCEISWQPWKQLDSLMARHNIRPTIYLLQMIE